MKNEVISVEKFVIERIKDNEKLFTEKELSVINNNVDLIKKIYIIGGLDLNSTQKF